MPRENDDQRRNQNRPEDNPFIAFRRFADSQVSSLLNTVFTLPATLANYNNAYHAREQCLFGQADPKTCERLHQIEEQITNIRAEGRELYKVGDVQSVLRKGEELMNLDREADGLRKEIVEGARGNDAGDISAETSKDLVERVGNEKGQQWGWSWSWGFPKSFDEAERENLDNGSDTDTQRGCRRWRRRPLENGVWQQEEEEWARFNARWEEIKKRMNQELPRSEDGEPRVWRWSWGWPPPADASGSDGHENEQPQNMFDELGNAIADEVTRMMLPRPFSFNNASYSPQSLEENEGLQRSGVQWRDAFEDLVRAERGASLIPKDQIGQSRQMTYNQWARRFWDPDFPLPQQRNRQALGEYPRRVPWEGEETSEDPSYEYGHDHEDQHDEPPTPKVGQGQWSEGMPATELDSYEKLLESDTKITEPSRERTSTSILSTLTTTERTVAPDGSVITKVVLKKRFADGREESSETIHTQRGQSNEGDIQDPWKEIQDAQFPNAKRIDQAGSKGNEENSGTKKSGWFWSN